MAERDILTGENTTNLLVCEKRTRKIVLLLTLLFRLRDKW